MASGVGVFIDNREILAVLDGVFDAAKDVSPAMDEIGSFGVAEIQLGFRSEKDPWGNVWEPSARARNQGGQTLRDTGQLYRSLLEYEANEEGVIWGTNKIYGAKHLFGVQPYLVARPFLPIRGAEVDLPQHWADEIERILVRHLGIES